ncbi:MRG-domain-containing protein [Kalaharituber pfeilii]|nr:MRG-domain-containing protein [Kalaharituber pfeilii]
MPPAASTPAAPTYKVDEKVLCFHGPMLYEAKVLDVKPGADKKDPPEYKVHYKGWKNTWDEYVPQDRLRKMTAENLDIQRNLKEQARPSQGTKGTKGTPDGKKATQSGKAGSEDFTAAPPTARGQKRTREMEMEKEDDFLRKHEIKLPIPDTLKAQLVDDWEYITKNQQLVPLPRNPNVVQILQHYREATPKKREGSAESDIFDEVIAGLKLYFDRSLGNILLYRFERQQLLDIRKEYPDKEASEIYGVEHLLRLFVSMPELLAHTNMDQQSVNKLREHLDDFVKFLSKNHETYFLTSYESASNKYIEQSKGV